MNHSKLDLPQQGLEGCENGAALPLYSAERLAFPKLDADISRLGLEPQA